jgi:UDP-3-O-[3-hydroxymyristoyl] glucosamine N-acyltransferase
MNAGVKSGVLTDFLISNGGRFLTQVIDEEILITGGKNIKEADKNEITFINKKYISEVNELVSNSKSRLIIVSEELSEKINTSRKDITIVLAADPKKLITDALKKFFTELLPTGIHPTVILGKDVTVGSKSSVGAYTVIDDNVTIGDNCRIENYVHIKENTVIGNDVYIKSGCIIGGKGFGFVKNSDQSWEDFPHFGKVIIENHVEIGSNTCIDKGALGDTRIGEGTKIDNLVHIAHNVNIGKHCLIIADAMLGGSVTIGENSWVAPSSAIRNGLTIGANSVIGMSAVVTKDVKPGVTVIGNPAVPLIKK